MNPLDFINRKKKIIYAEQIIQKNKHQYLSCYKTNPLKPLSSSEMIEIE